MDKKPSNLPEDTFHLMALATLFEGDFSIDWLLELTKMKASRTMLIIEDAIQRGWLVKKGPGIFCLDTEIDPKHFVVKENKQFHKDIAQVLMKELPDNDNKYQRIAHHLLNAANDVETARWLIKAGDTYLNDFRNEEAVQCYRKSIKDLSSLDGDQVDSLFVDAALKYSRISTARHHVKEVLSLLQKAMLRAKRVADQKSETLLEMHLAKNEWLASRYNSALSHFELGWSMANRLSDPSLLRSAMAFSTFFLYWQGRFQEAVRNYEKAVSDVEKYPKGRFPLLAAITVGQCYAFTGYVTQALGMLDAINSECIGRGDLSLASNAEGTIGSVMLEIRRMDEAIQYLEGALEKAQMKHNFFVQILGKLSLSYAHYLLGQNKKCIGYLRKFLNQSNQVKMRVQLYPYIMELCWAMEQGRLPSMSGLSIEEELQRLLRTKNIFLKGVAYRYRALLQRRDGQQHQKIFRSLRISLRWLQESGHQAEYAKTQLELARQYILVGKEEKAKVLLQKASGILALFNDNFVPDELRVLARDSSHGERLLNEILKLSQEVVTMRDNEDLGRHIISTVNRLTGAERGAIFLIDENSNPPLPQLRASKNLTCSHDPSRQGGGGPVS